MNSKKLFDIICEYNKGESVHIIESCYNYYLKMYMDDPDRFALDVREMEEWNAEHAE